MERVWGRNGSEIVSSKGVGREVAREVRRVRAEIARVVRSDEDYHSRSSSVSGRGRVVTEGAWEELLTVFIIPS